MALLLALVMCLGLTVPASAEQIMTKTIGDITITTYDEYPERSILSYTGSGALTESLLEGGLNLLIESGIYDCEITINIGPGISAPNESKLVEYFAEWVTVVEVNSGSSPAPQIVRGFTDVKKGDYFADPVAWAVDKKITTGTSETTFSPNENCTVAQILTFLWRAYGSPKASGSNSFSDVKDSDYYYGAALWAYEKGMVSGGTFNGSSPCTRSMAVTYIWKAAGNPAASGSKFTDVPAGADYEQAVNWAVEKGVTAGTSATTFSPDSVCTRGQIVTFLYRGLAG